MEYRIGRTLIPEEKIREKVKELGGRIREDYAGKQVVFVCVLKGAVVFLSALLREIGPAGAVELAILAIASFGASP